ncbi:MAG TPA: hypothetical protein VFF30_03110 [Nitrososphaerales archaeon]|nr:hypothetical protein [Nitrososphaerales archaeon]
MSEIIAKTNEKRRASWRYSWILVFIAPLFEALSGLLPLVGGYAYVHSQNVISQAIPASSSSVTINYLNVLARDEGLAGLFIGIFFAAVAATGYRKGDRWAWYAMLWGFLMGAVGFVVDALVQPLPGEAIVANLLIPVILGLMAIGLALPYRMFFPSKLPD